MPELFSCRPSYPGSPLRPHKKSVYNKDKLEEVYREPATFNKYVNPGSGVHFEERCVAVHGIHPSDPRITEADKLSVV